MLTLAPGMRLGIFSSYNGADQTDPMSINARLHGYLLDWALGVEPNPTSSADNARGDGTNGGASDRCHRRPEPKTVDEFSAFDHRSPVAFRRSVDAYTGRFYHRVLGRLTLAAGARTTKAASGDVENEGRSTDGGGGLRAVYGRIAFDLFPRSPPSLPSRRPSQDADVFDALPTDVGWRTQLGGFTVEFDEFDVGRAKYDCVGLPFLDASDEPIAVFRRRKNDDFDPSSDDEPSALRNGCKGRPLALLSVSLPLLRILYKNARRL